jgi:hypothetical protein
MPKGVLQMHLRRCVFVVSILDLTHLSATWNAWRGLIGLERRIRRVCYETLVAWFVLSLVRGGTEYNYEGSAQTWTWQVFTIANTSRHTAWANVLGPCVGGISLTRRFGFSSVPVADMLTSAEAFAKSRKAPLTSLSVRLYILMEQTRLSVDVFLWNFLLGVFVKICQQKSSFVII